MAGTPARAKNAEAALSGKPATLASIHAAMADLTEDFTPLTDMRASAEYRLEAAQNMLLRSHHAINGTLIDLHEVSA
jgi:xanthine dehydrogenase small subunit